MVSRLNVRAVLRLILQASVDMLQGQAGLIALEDEMGGFTFSASYGLPPAMVDSFVPLVEDMPRVEDTEDFSIPDLATKLSGIAEETGLLLRQVVALPMVAEQVFLGAIFIFRSHSTRFSADDRQILASFANYAAIAVNNARLYETAVTERQRLDALLESSADGIMVLQPNLQIERINRALVSLTGWSSDEAVGRAYSEVIVWERRQSNLTLEDAVAQGWPRREGPTLYIEGELRRRNGSVVSVGITYAPVTSRGGRLLNIIGTARDITHFREADTLKDTFISVVSHELKTPVSIIKGYAETLRRPKARQNPELVNEMLDDIVSESDRLARLVDDLLDASRLEAGGLSFHEIEDVDMSVIAQRVIERYQGQTDRHELTLEFGDEFPTIQGDAQRLEQVIDNLVSNAIKYSPRGGEVSIRGQFSPAEVVVSVSDEGVGIPLDEQERIFHRFYRIEGPETRAVSGTGLGLYLVRAIVEAHGGRTWIKSTPGQGATFYVALPRETGLALRQNEIAV
jgi:PAS domain S-box-containing protein